MKYPQNLYGIVADSIGNDVGSSWNNQFPGSSDATGSTHRGKTAEVLDSAMDCRHDACGGRRIVARDVFGFSVKVLQGCAQPPNAHGGPIFSGFAGLPLLWQNLRDLLL